MTDHLHRPCFAIDDGVFHIRTRSIQYRLQWQPEPLAMEHICGARSWRPCVPDFRLVRPVEPNATSELLAIDLPKDIIADEQKAAAFAAFRAMLPEQIVSPVELFGSHQWSMLVLLHARTEACDLAAYNPVLAYALANHADFRGTRQDLASGYACMHCVDRQRDILKWLGFPDTEAMVKIFHKMVPESVSPVVLRHLRNALREDDRIPGLLAHVPRINAGVLWSVVSPNIREIVSPKLMLAIAANEDDMVLAQTPDRLSAVLALLKGVNWHPPAAPLTTLAQVERFVESSDVLYREYLERQEQARQRAAVALAARIRRRRVAVATARDNLRKEEIQRPFPPPPVPGTDDIIPLISAAELVGEGVDQSNCVGGYAGMVKRGSCYIYRVLKPERATLSIVPDFCGGWRRSELKLYKNAKPGRATTNHVDRWLERHSLSV